MLLQKISNSLRFRTQRLIAQAMSHKLSNIPFTLNSLPIDDTLTVLSMTGDKHLNMLNECLISIAKTWNCIPRFIVLSDGSISSDSIRKENAWLGERLQVEDFETTIRYFKERNQFAVLKLAENHIFGKKLAFILHYAAHTPVLWTDSDILWFGKPQIPYTNDSKEVVLRLSEDIHPSYEPQLLMKVPGLKVPPYICAGVVYLSGDLLSVFQFNELVKASTEIKDYFTEQTLFAAATKIIGGDMWSLDEIHLSIADSSYLPLKCTFNDKPWKARHYVGSVRHHFWRDALELRSKKYIV